MSARDPVRCDFCLAYGCTIHAYAPYWTGVAEVAKLRADLARASEREKMLDSVLRRIHQLAAQKTTTRNMREIQHVCEQYIAPAPSDGGTNPETK